MLLDRESVQHHHHQQALPGRPGSQLYQLLTLYLCLTSLNHSNSNASLVHSKPFRNESKDYYQEKHFLKTRHSDCYQKQN